MISTRLTNRSVAGNTPRDMASSDARQRNKPGHPEEESENPHGGEPLTSAPDNHFRFSMSSPQHCNDLSGSFSCERQHCRLKRRGLHAAPCEGGASHARPIALRSSAHAAPYEVGTLLHVVRPE